MLREGFKNGSHRKMLLKGERYPHFPLTLTKFFTRRCLIGGRSPPFPLKFYNHDHILPLSTLSSWNNVTAGHHDSDSVVMGGYNSGVTPIYPYIAVYTLYHMGSLLLYHGICCLSLLSVPCTMSSRCETVTGVRYAHWKLSQPSSSPMLSVPSYLSTLWGDCINISY